MMIMTSNALRALSVVLTLYLCLAGTTGRTIDEIIASSSTKATNFDMIDDVSGTVLRLELDMMLTIDQYFALYGKQNSLSSTSSKTSPRKKRKAIKSLSTRWPSKRIPYRIEPSTFSNRDVAEIRGAIEEWETNTCIVFQPARSSDYNFINFEDGSGCSSHVGMVKGKQAVSLAAGCRSKGVVAHEIGHAVGFFHEQNRPDRDDYIIIKKENIVHPDLYHNFQKYDLSAVSTYGVPYDYMSIMHYGGTAFSGNGQYTIVTIKPEFQEVIGNRDGLSFNDIKLANLMYNCSELCSSSIRCPTEGFVGKDCQCWCPGNPIKKCGGGSTTVRPPIRPTMKPTLKPTMKPTPKPTMRPTMRPTVRPTPKTTCADMNANCPSWAKYDFCQSSDYVKTYCKASCSLCGGTRPPTTPCKDSRILCSSWGNRGYCSSMYATFMRKHCPSTCGVCKKQVNGMDMSLKTGTTEGSVVDNNNNNADNSGLAAASLSVLTILCGVLTSFICLF